MQLAVKDEYVSQRVWVARDKYGGLEVCQSESDGDTRVHCLEEDLEGMGP